MRFKVLLTAAAGLAGLGALNAVAQAPAASEVVEGRHFQRLTPAQPTSSAPGQIEVAEIFMYSCPACNSLEPHIEKWRATLPDNVNFIRVPASFNQIAKVHAQAFYTAEALGKTGDIDAPFFREIHENRNMLDSEAALARFFARFGVDEATFKSTFNSFAVHTKVQRADELIRRYRVPATPSIVVNGKYLTTGSMAGSYDGWFRIIDELVAREQAAGN